MTHHNKFLGEQSPNQVSMLLHTGGEGAVHVNSFEIKYREDGSVQQFLSDLSVADKDGAVLQRKQISVNSPMREGGVTYYQTDWSIAALSLRATGSPFQPADGSAFNLPMASLEGQPGEW